MEKLVGFEVADEKEAKLKLVGRLNEAALMLGVALARMATLTRRMYECSNNRSMEQAVAVVRNYVHEYAKDNADYAECSDKTIDLLMNYQPTGVDDGSRFKREARIKELTSKIPVGTECTETNNCGGFLTEQESMELENLLTIGGAA